MPCLGGMTEMNEINEMGDCTGKDRELYSLGETQRL